MLYTKLGHCNKNVTYPDPITELEMAGADKEEDSDEERKDPNVDGGYAWIILIGCFLMYLLTVGSIKAYGFLYTELVEYHGSGSGNTAWIGSVCVLFMLGLGPVANMLSKKYSFRRVSFVGGVLLGLGFLLSGFVPDMEYMYLTFGLCSGFGYGLSFSPCSTIINFYFVKHRALANGIIVSASGIGALSFPFLYKFLIENFGLNGMLWIMGAILTNVCVAACVFRQPKLLVQEKRRHIMEEKRKSDQKALLNGNAAYIKSDDDDEEDKYKSKRKKCSDCGLGLKFSLFKNPLFVMLAIAFTFCMNGHGNNIILIPSYVKDLGYNKNYIALSVTIMGCCEVVSRIFFGWFADLKIVKRRNIFLVCMFISAIAAFIIPYFDNFIFVAIYAGIVGTFPGSFWSLISVMVIDRVGMENFTPAFGLVSLCLAVGAVVSNPIIGWLKDIYGGWHQSFILTGCLFLVSGFTTLLEPIIIRCCMKPETNEEELNMLAGAPLRHSPRKPIELMTSKEEDTSSVLDEEAFNVSFSSHRISKIYRPVTPESPPQSPQRTSAPIVDPTDI